MNSSIATSSLSSASSNGIKRLKVGSAAIKGLIASAKATANNARRSAIDVDNEEKKVPRTTTVTVSSPSMPASDNLRNEILRLKKELQQSVPKSQLLETDRKYKELKKQLDEANQKLRASDAAYQRLASKLKSKGESSLTAVRTSKNNISPNSSIVDLSESELDLSTTANSVEASLHGINSIKKKLQKGDVDPDKCSKVDEISSQLLECQKELERTRHELRNCVPRSQLEASERLCAELKRLCDGPLSHAGASPEMLRMFKAQVVECESKLSAGEYELNETKKRLLKVEQANDDLAQQMSSVKLVLDDASAELMKMSKQMSSLKASADAKVKKLEERLERELEAGRQAAERCSELEQKLLDSRMVCDTFMLQANESSVELENCQLRIHELEDMLESESDQPLSSLAAKRKDRMHSQEIKHLRSSHDAEIEDLKNQIRALTDENSRLKDRIFQLEEELLVVTNGRETAKAELISAREEMAASAKSISETASLAITPSSDQLEELHSKVEATTKALQRANGKAQEQDKRIEYLSSELEQTCNDLLEARKILVQRVHEDANGAMSGDSESGGMATQLLRLKRQLLKKDTDILDLNKEIVAVKRTLSLLQLNETSRSANESQIDGQVEGIERLSAELSKATEAVLQRDLRIAELEQECNGLENSLGAQMRLVKLKDEQLEGSLRGSDAVHSNRTIGNGDDAEALAAANRRIEQLTCQMEGMTIALEMLNDRLEGAENSASMNEEADAKLRQEFEHISAENADLQTRLAAAEDRNLQLAHEIMKLKQEVIVDTSVAVSASEGEKLKKEVVQLQSELICCQEQLRAKDRALDDSLVCLKKTQEQLTIPEADARLDAHRAELLLEIEQLKSEAGVHLKQLVEKDERLNILAASLARVQDTKALSERQAEEISRLTSSLTSAGSEMNKKIEDISKLREEIRFLRSKGAMDSEGLLSENVLLSIRHTAECAANQRVLSLETKLRDSNDEITSLSCQLSNVTKAYEDCMADLTLAQASADEMRGQNSELRRVVVDLEYDKARMARSSTEGEVVVNDLRKELSELEKQLVALKDANKEMEKQVSQLRTSKGDLEARLSETLRRNVEMREEMKAEMEIAVLQASRHHPDSTTDANRLNEELVSLKLSLQAKVPRELLTESESRAADLQRQITDIRRALDSSAATLTRMSKEKAELEQRLSHSKRTIDELQASGKSQSQVCLGLQRDLAESRILNDDKDYKIKELNRANAALEAAIKELNVKQQKSSKSENEAKEKLARYREMIDSQSAENSQFLENKNSAEIELVSSRLHYEQTITGLEDRIREITAESTNLKEQCSVKSTKLANLEAKCSELQLQLDTTRRTLDIVSSSVTEGKTSQESYEEQLSTCQRKLAVASSELISTKKLLDDTRANAKVSIEALEIIKEGLEDKLSTSNTKLDTAVTALKTKTVELEGKCSTKEAEALDWKTKFMEVDNLKNDTKGGLEFKCTELRESVADWKKRYKELSDKFEVYSRSLGETQDELVRATAARESISSELAEVKVKLVDRSSKVRELEVRIADLLKQLEFTKGMLDKTATSLATTKSSKDEAETGMAQFHQQLVDAIANRGALEARESLLLQQIDETSAALEGANSRVATLSSEVEVLNQKLNAASQSRYKALAEVAEMSGLNKALEARLAIAEKSLQEGRGDLSRVSTDLSSRAKDLQDELESTWTRLEQCQEELKRSSSQKNDVSCKLAQLESVIDNKDAEIMSLRERDNVLQAELMQAQSELNNIRANVSDFAQERRALTDEIYSLESQVVHMTNTINGLRQTGSQLNSNVEIIQSEQRMRMNEFDRIREELEGEVKALQDELDFTKVVLDDTASTLVVMREAKESLAREKFEMEKKYDSDIAAMKSEVLAMAASQDYSTLEWQTKCKDVEAVMMKTVLHWERRYSELEQTSASETSAAEAKYRALQEQSTRAEEEWRSQYESLKTQFDYTRQSLTGWDDAVSIVNGEKVILEQEIQALRQEHDRCKAELNAALMASKALYEDTAMELENTKDQLDSECSENVSLGARKRDLENELASVRLEAMQTVQRLQADINSLEKELSASKHHLEVELLQAQRNWDSVRNKMEAEAQNLQQQLDFSRAVLDETAATLTATKRSRECIEAELVDTKQQLDNKVRVLVKSSYDWEAKCSNLDSLLTKTTKHWEQSYEDLERVSEETKQRLESQLLEDKRFHEMQLAHVEAAHRIEVEEAAARLGQVKHRLAETEQCLESVVNEKNAIAQSKAAVEAQLATVSRALKDARSELSICSQEWIDRLNVVQSELEEARSKQEQMANEMLALSSSKISVEAKLTGARAIIDQMTGACGDSDLKCAAFETEILELKKDFDVQRKKTEEKFSDERKKLQQQISLMQSELHERSDALSSAKAAKIHLEAEYSSLELTSVEKIEDLSLLLNDSDEQRRKLSSRNVALEKCFEEIETVVKAAESKRGESSSRLLDLGSRCSEVIEQLELQIDDLVIRHERSVSHSSDEAEAKFNEVVELLQATKAKLVASEEERSDLNNTKLGLEAVLDDTRTMMLAMRAAADEAKTNYEVDLVRLTANHAEDRRLNEERYQRLEQLLDAEKSSLGDRLTNKAALLEEAQTQIESLKGELEQNKELMNDTLSATVQLKYTKQQLQAEVADLQRSLESSTGDLCAGLLEAREECSHHRDLVVDWERKYADLEAQKKKCEVQITEMGAEYKVAIETYQYLNEQVQKKTELAGELQDEMTAINALNAQLRKALDEAHRETASVTADRESVAVELKETLEILAKTEDEMRVVCGQLQSHVVETEDALENVKDALANVATSKANIEAEYFEFRMRSEMTIEEMMKSSQEEIEASGQKCVDLQRRLSEMRETAKALNEQLQEKSNDAAEAYDRQTAATTRVAELESRIDEMNKFLDEIATSNGKLTAEVAYLTESKSRLVETEEKLAQTNQMLEASVSRAELIASEARCEQLHRQLEVLKRALDDTTEQLARVSATEDELVAARKLVQNRVSRDKLVEVEAKCADLSMEIVSMEHVIESLQDRLKEKDMAFARQAKQTEELRWQLQDLQLKVDEANAVDGEMRKMSRYVKDVEARISEQQDSERALQRGMDHMQEVIQDLTAANATKESTIAQMVVEMKDKVSRGNLLQARCAELENHMSNLESVLEDLRNQNAALEDVINQSRQEDAYLQSKVVHQLEQIESSANERVSRVRMEVEEKVARSYGEQIVQLQSRIMELESKNVKMLTELSVASAKLDKANKRCSDLEVEALHASSVTPEQYKQLEDRYTELQRRLNEMREMRNAIKVTLKEREDELADCQRKLEASKLQLAASRR